MLGKNKKSSKKSIAHKLKEKAAQFYDAGEKELSQDPGSKIATAGSGGSSL